MVWSGSELADALDAKSTLRGQTSPGVWLRFISVKSLIQTQHWLKVSESQQHEPLISAKCIMFAQ